MYRVECSHTVVPSSLQPTWEHVFSSSPKKPWSPERSGVPISFSLPSLSQPLTRLPSVRRSVAAVAAAHCAARGRSRRCVARVRGRPVTAASQGALPLLFLLFCWFSCWHCSSTCAGFILPARECVSQGTEPPRTEACDIWTDGTAVTDFSGDPQCLFQLRRFCAHD